MKVKRTFCLMKIIAVTLVTCLFSIYATSAFSQNAKSQNEQQKSDVVSGTVVDVAGIPIIGANVIVKGTNRGEVTDMNGTFVLDAPKGSVLLISFIGYNNKEVKVDGSDKLTIVLQENTKLLEEIVVVGYGTQKKVNLSGSVASISTQEIEGRPIQNVSTGLQGLMPGVTITGANGAPGMDGGVIRVRGIGTLNNANPLILIDGFETGDLNSLDPNDIASISVLKDAASASIYGSKAANGVILITTKRGKSGAPKVTYNGYLGFQNATATINRMSSYEYATLYDQLLVEAGKSERFGEEIRKKFKDGTDPDYPNNNWYDLAYRTGIQHRHNVNVSGGTESVKYHASVGYLNQKGILPNAGRQQFNGRTNLDMDINDRMTVRMGLSFIRNNYSDASSAYYGGSSDQLIRQLNLIAPWIVARYPDGTYGTISDGNPIAWLDAGIKVKRKNSTFNGQVAMDYNILSSLKFTLQGAYATNIQNYNYFQPFIQYNPNKATEPNKLDNRFYKWERSNVDALLNYDKTFCKKHNLKALAGWHIEKFDDNSLGATRKYFPNNELTDMNAGDESTMKNSGITRQLNMVSWFGRINYDYAGKYLLEANFRADASSRFADGYRWGYFPSFSGAWRITEEPFMDNLKRTWLNNLKLRASWGKLGNQAAFNDYYPALNTYSLGKNYPFDGQLNSGYAQTKFRINDISWEETSTWGVGIDFTLFDSLTGSIDYYNKKTTGIIMDVDVPREFALGAYKDNVGAMKNSGIELQLNYRTMIGEVDFGVSGNFAYNKNEITNLGDSEVMGDFVRNAVGHPINSYYTYKTDGFFNSQKEADDYTAKYGNPFKKKFMAGDLKYVDTNNDGKLDGNDRVYCGNPQPDITYGFKFTANWKGFDIAAMFNGAAKAERSFDAVELYGQFAGDAAHPSTVWRDAWTPENTNAKMPRLFLDLNSPSCSRITQSDFWIEDISYLRFKNLQIGYTLPKNVTSKLGIGNVRFYYSVENLFTLDNMKVKVDPEVTSSRLSSYPLLRTHSFGVNVSF